MTQAIITVPAFDATSRNAFYQEVMVSQNNVDPATGLNVGSPDTTSTLDIVISNQPIASGGVPVVVTQVGIVPSGQTNAGARIMRLSPGVMQPTDAATQWTVDLKVHGAPQLANTTRLNGLTPPPPNMQGVLPVGEILTAQP